LTMFAVTPWHDIAHRLGGQLAAKLEIERAIPGYGPLQASPLSTAKGRGMGLPNGCATVRAPAGHLEVAKQAVAKQAFQASADAVYVD
jgi:inorganic triphosphatase YgiF